MINRWFTKCATCLVVTAIDERPAHNAVCGLCAGHVENMGRVERDRLIDEHLQCKCDDRCTSARGPHCTCKCGAANHGAGLIGGYAIVRTDRGPVPTVTPSAGKEQARVNAADFRAAIAALTTELSAILDRRAAGEFLPRPTFDRMRALQHANAKAHKSRDHRSRMTILRKIIGHVPPSPIADFAQAIDHAPKIADAPFTLRAPAAPDTPVRQSNLF